MRLTEGRIRQIVSEAIGKVMSKRSIINRIYKVTQPLTSHLYSDEYWKGVSDMSAAIQSVGVDDVSIYPVNGGYRTSKDGLSQWKEYAVEITYNGGVINGSLNCHAAGTVKNPFARYDMTLVMW